MCSLCIVVCRCLLFLYVVCCSLVDDGCSLIVVCRLLFAVSCELCVLLVVCSLFVMCCMAFAAR